VIIAERLATLNPFKALPTFEKLEIYEVLRQELLPGSNSLTMEYP